MANERLYTTRRQGIIEALAKLLCTIDGSGDNLSDLNSNVHPTLKFWDEVEEFPAVHLNAGGETRDYQTAGYKDRYLTVFIKVYVQEEDAWKALAAVLEDIETVLEENQALLYVDKRGNQCRTQMITLLGLDTDEGVLEPLGVGELTIEVRY